MSFSNDINRIALHPCIQWNRLSNCRILLTGGTGFFGTWLLESFVKANAIHKLNAQLYVLSRSPQAFKERLPQLASNSSICWIQGDVQDVIFPDIHCDYVIPGAMTSAAETFHKTQTSINKYDLVVNGTRRILDFSERNSVRKILLLSSGSAYGRQPTNMMHIKEDYSGGPLTTEKQFDFSVLGEAKRVAEMLSTIYAEQHGIQVAIARCFSFVGPFLPLDLHYAIGNFIMNILNNEQIVIRGDGQDIRSYQYIGDTIIWLWSVLLGNFSGIMNVGSDNGLSIKELAYKIALLTHHNKPILIQQEPDLYRPVHKYVPSIEIAKKNGLECWVTFDESIERTLEFFRQQNYENKFYQGRSFVIT